MTALEATIKGIQANIDAAARLDYDGVDTEQAHSRIDHLAHAVDSLLGLVEELAKASK